MSDIPAPESPLGHVRPLEGIRVVELASVLAGPLVGTFLAELGADVLKVEPPGWGDVTRHWRGPQESSEGISAYFAAANGPKRALRLDLKSEDGQKQLQSLLEDTDILLQNAKTASLSSLGLDPTALSKSHPRLIHVHLRGFLHQPDRGGYDMVVQAESGFVSMNAGADGVPFRLPVAFMDVLAAHQMRSGLLLALWEREKTGLGSYVQTWLDAAGTSGLVNRATEHLVAGSLPKALGALHPQIAPYGETFRCKDGRTVITAVGQDRQFEGLCQLLEHPELASDPRFSSNAQRVRHRGALAEMLAPSFRKWSAADLLKEAAPVGIPLGLLRNVDEALATPTGQSMTAHFEWEGEALSHVRQVAFRIQRNGNRMTT